ncbi:ABC transporter substrate-binding protein, partial [Aurantimonas coralicida]|uniref:ABC transporter substrate-binding protein n=1 Tax=Aurantimonas coralicida TaxID=182270 RepID=UPI00351219BA
GELVPWLVDEIPTVENGGVSEDLMSITWTISEGILWADGTPVTSADLAFTAEYCMHPEGGCAQGARYQDVESVEIVDDRTVTVHFSVAKPVPSGPFVTAPAPIRQAAQLPAPLRTVTARRFCDQQEMSSHTATGRSLP